MEVLTQIVRDMAVLILLTLFLQLILPSGALAGFVRMIMGLLLLAAFINPLLHIFDQPIRTPVFSSNQYQKQTEEVLAEGARLSSQWQEEVGQEWQQGLAGQIEALALLQPDIQEADCQVLMDQQGGEVKKIDLDLYCEQNFDQEQLTSKLKTSIGEFFALPREIIACNFHLESGIDKKE